jgi:hypothetical protein
LDAELMTAEPTRAEPPPVKSQFIMRRSEEGDFKFAIDKVTAFEFEQTSIDQAKTTKSKKKKKKKIRSGIITGIVALGIAVLALAFMGIHHVRTRGRADFGEMQHHQKPARARPPNVDFVDRSANPLYQRASVSAVLGRSAPPGSVLQSCGSVASYASIAARRGFDSQLSVKTQQYKKFHKNSRPNACQM